MAGGKWPAAGPPPYFTSAAHYDALAAVLRETGATPGERTLYWDVRPCAHLPTVEIRAMDVTADVTEAAALALLVRALVVQALERVELGDPGPDVSEAVLRAAYWRSARDGWPGHGLDPRSNRLVPTTHLVRDLLGQARPALDAFGELRPVTDVLHRLSAHGGGAQRQRAAYARRGSLRDVVEHVAEHTARPAPADAVPTPAT